MHPYKHKKSAGWASDVIWPLHHHQSYIWEPTRSQEAR